MKRVFIDLYIKFRLGISDLHVHKHRYTANNDNLILCPFCHDKKEDEVHFLLECPTYDGLRTKHLDKEPDERATKEIVFSQYMSSQEESIVRKTISFIFHAFRARSVYLYRLANEAQ